MTLVLLAHDQYHQQRNGVNTSGGQHDQFEASAES
jgi:hypothetical protein